MLKRTDTLPSPWVKNVYRLGTQTGINSDYLYTKSSLGRMFVTQPVDNSLVTPLFVQVVASLLSTLKNARFNPLYSYLYPQSTAPTNKTKKKI
jgi:hypothetical protein